MFVMIGLLYHHFSIYWHQIYDLFTNIYEIVYLQMIKYLKIKYLLLTILSIKSLL